MLVVYISNFFKKKKYLTEIIDATEHHLAKVQEEPNQAEPLYVQHLYQPIHIQKIVMVKRSQTDMKFLIILFHTGKAECLSPKSRTHSALFSPIPSISNRYLLIIQKY